MSSSFTRLSIDSTVMTARKRPVCVHLDRDLDLPGRDIFLSSQLPQQGELSAAGRADQGDKFVTGDLYIRVPADFQLA